MMEMPMFDFGDRRRRSIQQRFDEWVETEDGQEVYQNCLERVWRLRRRGWRFFGMKAIWEAARYDRALQVGPDAEGFKLSNDFHARMARYILDRNPELMTCNDGAPFFHLRELRA